MRPSLSISCVTTHLQIHFSVGQKLWLLLYLMHELSCIQHFLGQPFCCKSYLNYFKSSRGFIRVSPVLNPPLHGISEATFWWWNWAVEPVEPIAKCLMNELVVGTFGMTSEQDVWGLWLLPAGGSVIREPSWALCVQLTFTLCQCRSWPWSMCCSRSEQNNSASFLLPAL